MCLEVRVANRIKDKEEELDTTNKENIKSKIPRKSGVL